MCGIGLCIWNHSSNTDDVHQDLSHIQDSIQHRGPDCFQCYKMAEFDIAFMGSVLSLRGSEITEQPLISSLGDIFIWNGEVFDGLKVVYVSDDKNRLIQERMIQ